MTTTVELDSPAPDPSEIAMANIASGLSWGAQFVTDFSARPAGTPPLGPTSIPSSVRHSPESGCPHVDIGINGRGRVEDMLLWLDLLSPDTRVVVCRNDSAKPFVRMSAYILYGGSALIRLHSHLYADEEMAKLWKVMDTPEIGDEVAIGRDVLEAAVAEGDALDQDGEPPPEDDEEDADDDGLVEVLP